MFGSPRPPGPSGDPLRPMNNIPTYRRGRRIYRPGSGDNDGLGGVCSVLFLSALLLAAPAAVWISESHRRSTYVALRDALDSGVAPLSPASGVGDLLHAASSDLVASSSDPDMGVSVPWALAMRRRTEYCQWQELRGRECRTCTRTVRADDGSQRGESYECDCVTTYDYVKAWRGHRINSMLFDQPAAHHNPQRDPMPPVTLPADSAVLRAGEGGADAVLDPSMLAKGVRGARWRPVDFVPNGTPPVPPFWARWIPDRTRYEPASTLSGALRSPAARRDNFVYVGQGGYFFSPYDAGIAETLFKWFGGYLEGSIMDWQIGDLMPSCTAGDVRFYYEVQDPNAVSVVGEVTGRTKGAGRRAAKVNIGPRTAPNGRRLGLVHAGRKSPRSMIADEDSDSRWWAAPARASLLLWSVAATRLLGALAGRDVGGSRAPTQVAAALAVWFAAMGSSWACLWGASVDSTFAFLGAAFLAVVAWRHVRRSDVPGGVNAAWCMLGRWANVPPSWRVESSYRGNEGKEKEL